MDDCADTFESGREIGGGDVRNFDDFNLGYFSRAILSRGILRPLAALKMVLG
jgi:hypothetical protein